MSLEAALAYQALGVADLAWERKLRAAGYRVDATPWTHAVYPREERR